MKKVFLAVIAFLLALAPASAQVPQLVNYQGRIQIGADNFDGIGYFKFALVTPGNGHVFWTNDGTGLTGANGGEPQVAVPIRVTKGLYSILLGDTTLENMTALSSAAFGSGNVYLRIWFNDGTNGFQWLRPDQRFAAVGYAMISGSVLDGSITTAKLALGSVKAPQLDVSAVTTEKLANAAVTAEKLGPASVLTGNILDGSITTAKIADWSVGPSKIDDRYSLWNKGGSVLSYSGGKVGIGTVTPDAALEVSTGDRSTAALKSSASGGTWFGLQNSSPGGNAWSLISTGSGNGEGAGKLLFFSGEGASSKMQLDPNGNLKVAGNISAANLQPSLIQFSQDSPAGISGSYDVGNVKNIDEISVVTPGSGFLHITAFVKVSVWSDVAVMPQKFIFLLYDATPGPGGQSQQIGLTGDDFRVHAAEGHITLHLSWVLPVDAAKTVVLRTQGVYEYGNFRAQTFGHNLTAIYIPRRAQ